CLALIAESLVCSPVNGAEQQNVSSGWMKKLWPILARPRGAKSLSEILTRRAGSIEFVGQKQTQRSLLHFRSHVFYMRLEESAGCLNWQRQRELRHTQHFERVDASIDCRPHECRHQSAEKRRHIIERDIFDIQSAKHSLLRRIE